MKKLKRKALSTLSMCLKQLKVVLNLFNQFRRNLETLKFMAKLFLFFLSIVGVYMDSDWLN